MIKGRYVILTSRSMPKRFLLGLFVCVLIVSSASQGHASSDKTRFPDLPLYYGNEAPLYFSKIIAEIDSSAAIKGYPDGTFDPNGWVKRAEFLKMLLETEGVVTSHVSRDCFPDAKIDQWYAPYVCYAKDKNLVAGYSDGKFHPEREINLVEAIKILNSFYQLPNKSLTIELGTVHPWYYAHVQAAIADRTLTPYKANGGMDKYMTKYITFNDPLSRLKAFELVIRYAKASKGTLKSFLGANWYDWYGMLPVVDQYGLYIDPQNLLASGQSYVFSSCVLGTLFYNQQIHSAGCVNTVMQYTKPEWMGSVYDYAIEVYNFDSKTTKVVDRTHYDLTTSANDALAFSDFTLSPSGYLAEYRVSASGQEFSTGKVRDIEAKTDLTWDLISSPKIVWSPDRKQAVFGNAAGLYGYNFKKTVRGDINKTEDVVTEVNDPYKWVRDTSYIFDYNFISNEELLVEVYTDEGIKQYVIGLDGQAAIEPAN